MGQTTASTSIVTTTENLNLPQHVAVFSAEYGLTVAQAQDVQVILQEHQTNLQSVRTLLDEGLTVAEVSEVYDVRARIDTALESSDTKQRVSMTAIVKFHQEFHELVLDAECLTEHLLQIKEDLPTKYFNHALEAITAAAQRYDCCFADVLAAYINGELEETDA
jgi:hypothetical protein